MRLPPLWRTAGPEVMEPLRALRDEFPSQRPYIDSMLMYARFGRHRWALGPEFVMRVRSWCLHAERASAAQPPTHGGTR